MPAQVLIVPGLGGSGPDHWQSRWQARLPEARRVEQADWDRPERAGWIAQLDHAVAQAKQPPLLVAHSLSCALVTCWAAMHARPVHAALLVAPADIESDKHTPPEAHVFRPLPMTRLPFPTIVVASRDDPYVAFDRASAMAKAWGAELVDIGNAGHINTASGYREWPEGERLLQRLQAGKPAYQSA
ncbi:MAG TPA: alpha/beta hydrolase [Dongiaceae bacterium]|nr:alpha/beta hydrolase [Dongiaceae bacterium]